MTNEIRWGVLATGAIGHTFARGLADSKTGVLTAVGSRTQEKADAFASEFGNIRAHGGYEDLVADNAVDAIYVSTPHPYHAQWAIAALQAGKHVLVEKPIGMHESHAKAMIQAAVCNNRFLMEAYMYRCHPQTATLVDLIKSDAIGPVRLIKATFSFGSLAGFNADGRTWSNTLGGGGILDVGGYTTSISRLVAGAALGRSFADPVKVSGSAYLHPESSVDAWSVGTLEFEQGIIAQIATGVGLNQRNNLLVYGDKGYIEVSAPYCAVRSGACNGEIVVHAGGKAKTITVPSSVTSFTLEADVVGAAIAAGKQQCGEMSWDDTLGNIRTQDLWRDAVGLVYESEKREGCVPTVYGRPIEKQPDALMIYGQVPGVEKPVSRLVMGCDNQQKITHCAVMFDDFFEKGGNTFDTAYIYGGGLQEELLGEWIRMRGVRDQVNIIAKGAHTPHCFPDSLTEQLMISLDRLQTDCAEIYFMHRDNPEVPVGEFVDVLNEHMNAGRIKAFGGSNWTLERLAAANAYAREHDLRGFDVVSNNFSLARMVNPVWHGCVAASEPEQKAWFEKTGTSLFSWSSQARGFFTDRSAPDQLSDEMLAKCWYSDENFARKERATQLAEERGVEPISIAGAYVLSQTFPTYALIGPRQLSETASSMDALAVGLTPEEVRWLETGEGH